jgi:hypothetical protein
MWTLLVWMCLSKRIVRAASSRGTGKGENSLHSCAGKCLWSWLMGRPCLATRCLVK